MFSLIGVILLLCMKSFCSCEYIIPNATLEAYKPAGFRASIPADDNIEYFGFHGKVNKPISQIEYGEFSGNVRNAINGYFTYYNPNLNLTEGDVVNYWIFIQYKQLGYRKDGLSWTVTEQQPEPGTACKHSVMKVSDRTRVCTDIVVFKDEFETLDESKWTREKYIPGYPDYEFVIYKPEEDVSFIKDNKLCIKPNVAKNLQDLKADIDLSNGCTRTRSTECIRKVYLLQNPVTSGRIVTKLKFSYGEFEVKARLPLGDWIFPEIYLEDDTSRRILIAFSRGNAQLTDSDGSDIGGNILYGGPIANHTSPHSRSNLKFTKANEPLSKNIHIYKLRWTPDNIKLFLDGNMYGEVPTEYGFTGEDPGKFHLVIGIGVGGISDFPNDAKSGQYDKPWINSKANQVKTFYLDMANWLSTWNAETSQLQIDYVKVSSV